MRRLLSAAARAAIAAAIVLTCTGALRAQTAAPPPGSAEAQRQRLFKSLDSAPNSISLSPTRSPYNPLTIVRIVNALQPLGTDRAVSVLEAYIASGRPPASTERWLRSLPTQRIGIALVMRAVFDPPKHPGYMESLGPDWGPAPKDPKQLPRYPMAIAGGLPLLVMEDYPNPMVRVDLPQQLAWYRANCKVRAQPLKPKDRPLELYRQFNRMPYRVCDTVWTALSIAEDSLYPNPKDRHYTPDQSLIRAIEAGDVDAVRTLLEHGANPNARSAFGETALRLAFVERPKTGKDRLAMARELLQHGADPNLKDLSGYTVMEAAARTGSTEAVDLLRQRKVDPERPGRGGVTALIAAAQSGSPDLVKHLLDLGADPRKMDSYGELPLVAAASSGSVQTVALFLDRGESVLERDGQGESVLTAALRIHSNPEMVRYLLDRGADVHARTNNGDCPLTRALEFPGPVREKQQILKLLLGHGASPLVAGWNGETPLENVMAWARDDAVKFGMARLLMDHGAVLFTNRPGYTAFLRFLVNRACDHDDALPLLRKELQYASPITSAPSDEEPLTAMVVRKAIEARDSGGTEARQRLMAIAAMLVDRLRDAGAWSPSTGRTPLSDAAIHHDTEVIKLLAKHGANMNALDRDGSTPHIAAISRGDMSLAGFLLRSGASASAQDRSGLTPLMAALRRNDTAFARKLLSAHASPNVRDHQGITPLVLMVRRRDLAFVRLLLDHGAYPNGIPEFGERSPLGAALETGSAAIVEELLKRGALPNMQATRDGTSPLMQAARLGDSRLVSLLLEHHADPLYELPETRRAALDVARASGNAEVIRLLQAAADQAKKARGHRLIVPRPSGHSSEAPVILR